LNLCGPIESHACITDYKLTIEVCEVGYNKMVDSFRMDTVGGFARVIVVSPLHEKFPQLVLVACYTCNCFYSSWIRVQTGKNKMNCGQNTTTL